MTGPEHYREAERLVTLAAGSSRERPDWSAEYLSAAQVNATLALAAALIDTSGDKTIVHATQWAAATHLGGAS